MKKLSPLVLGLLASVALNGILIGVLVAGQKSATPDTRRNGPPLDIGNIARSLPDSEREAFAKTLPAGRGTELSQALRELNKAQRELGVLLSAQTLDILAIDSAMADIRLKRVSISKQGDTAIAAYFATLTPERRKAIVEDISQRRRGGGPDGQSRDAPRGSRDNAGAGMTKDPRED